MQAEHEKTLGTKSMNSIFVFREIIFVNLKKTLAILEGIGYNTG